MKKTSFLFKLTTFACCVVVLYALGINTARADVNDVVIKLSASRTVLEADGSSTSEITASVSKSSGGPVPDGTEIAFSVDLGQLEPDVAVTKGGIARTTLISDVKEGVATLIATERGSGAEARLKIEYSSDVGRAEKGWQLIHVKAKWVKYGVDSRTVEASGNVHFSYKRLEVTADRLFFDLERGWLKARGEVQVKSTAKNGRTWEGRALWLDVFANQGAIIVAGKHLATVGISGSRLEEQPDYEPPSEAFLPAQSSDDRLAIICRRVIIYPGEKVMCERAKVYMEGQRVLSLPYYFVPLAYGADVLNPKFGVSTSGGLEADLPFFYAVSERRVGAIRLVRGSLGEWSGGSGWTLGLEEQYAPNPQDKVIFDYDNLTRSDWGMRLHATFQQSGRRSTYFTMGYPRHDYLYLSGTTYTYHDGASTSLTSYISRQVGDSNYDVNARWRYQAGIKPLSGFSGLRWRGNVDLLFDNRTTLSDRTAVSGGLDLLWTGWKLGSGFRLTPRMRLGRGIANDGDSEHTFVFNLELANHFARSSYFTLRYSYSDTNKFGSDYPYTENLLFNLRWRPSYKLGAYVSSRYDLHSSDYMLDASQSYRINDNWSLALYQVNQKHSSYSYTDYEINLRRQLPNGAIGMLRWSKARDRVWLEFSTSQLLF